MNQIAALRPATAPGDAPSSLVDRGRAGAYHRERMAAARKRDWLIAILAPAFVAAHVLCFCAATTASATAHAQTAASKGAHDCCPDEEKRESSHSDHGSCGHCNAAQLCTTDRPAVSGPAAASVLSFVPPTLHIGEVAAAVSRYALSAREHGGGPPGGSVLKLKCVLLI